MTNYIQKSIVSSSEAEALKEMIFQRARARAEALTKETETSYTTAVHADIMDLARNTVNPDKNPFRLIAEPQQEQQKPEQTPVQVEEKTIKTDGLGFSPRKHNTVKTDILTRNKDVAEVLTSKEVLSVMDDAHNNLSRKQSFTGALNFLNSQASISLIKSRGKAFEAMA